MKKRLRNVSTGLREDLQRKNIFLKKQKEIIQFHRIEE